MSAGYVLYRPTLLMIWKYGTSSMTAGNIWVTSKNVTNDPFPRNSKRDRP